MPCTSTKTPLASLAGSEWGFPDAGDANVQFKEKDVSGFAGCNRFRGTYTFDGGALTSDAGALLLREADGQSG